MVWKKGQSGNPGGRPKIDPNVREAIGRNGQLAVQRMHELLTDDAAWGQGGWMKPREQIMLATLAQERAYGKPDTMVVGHVHGGTVELRPHVPDLRNISDQLPERRAIREQIEAKSVKQE